jgi:serine/threonine-protein kinase
MKRAALPLGLGLLLSACGSRTGLSPHDDGAPGEPRGLVPFPSLEESTAVLEPAPPPSSRPREQRYSEDGGECALAVPSLDAVLSRIQADVLAQPAGDRPFLRYVSAAFLVPKFCRVDSAVNYVADALPLLLNSLSLTENAASAQPLDGDEALLRIDLRSVGWDRPIRSGGVEHADAWEALSANAALSVALRGPEADALLEQTGTRTPLLHAHDLARAALGADIYYALLGAPATLDELRSALGIPPELEAEPNAYWRAITTQSRVSRQDRVQLRYRGPAGAPLFWHTLDRRPDAASATAFAEPLGREGDESSVIYTLPNGLPAYFLADSGGRRLDESRVLIDASEGDFVPHTAPSCMRCHSDAGVIQVTDELRPYAATDPNGRFSPRELELLAEVYPPQEDLDALIEADRRRLEDAQARLGIPGPGSGGLLDELVLSRDRDVPPALAAAELFVSPAELSSRRAELPGTLRVLTSVGNLSRESFDAAYREALCALSREARNQPLDCP